MGIQVDPQQPLPSAKKTAEGRWVDTFQEILADNKEAATDFGVAEVKVTVEIDVGCSLVAGARRVHQHRIVTADRWDDLD